MFNKLIEDNINIMEVISLPSKKILFKENEICKKVGIILSGELNIVSYSFKGNEIAYAKLKSGDIFGDHLIFSTNPRYKGNVIARTKSTIGFITKDNFIKLLSSNPSLLEEYLKKEAENTLNLNNQIKILSFDNALEKLMFYLSINDNEIKYQSVSSLARTLNLRRETLSRLLSELIRKKVIYKDDYIIKLF